MGSFTTSPAMTSFGVLVAVALLCTLQLERVSCGARPRPRPIFVQPQAEARTRVVTEPLVDGIHSVERFVGDLFSPIFGGPVASGSNDKDPKDSYGIPSYTSYIAEPPKPKKKEKIPCGGYGYANRRSFGSGVLNGGKKEDDCGVYAEAENGFGFQENCEYIHETIFKTKYKTECSKTYSTQCQTSYKTECTTSLNQECRTEYKEECSYADSEECITVDRPSYHQVCDTEYVQDCDGGGYKNTYEAPPPCATVPKQVCRQVAEFHQETECTNVPKKSCVTSPREVCGDVPKQDCKLVPTSTNCKDIPEKLCRQRAYQYPESITRQVCGLGPSQPSGGKKGKGKKVRK